MRKYVLSLLQINLLLLLACCSGTDINWASQLRSYNTIAYNYDFSLGDFTSRICLTNQQQTEFQKILQYKDWEKADDLPDRGYEVVLSACNQEGGSLDIALWDDSHTLIVLQDDNSVEDKVFYLAPMSISQQAEKFKVMLHHSGK